jgi:DNA-binding GntR family transcriptional regulator
LTDTIDEIVAIEVQLHQSLLNAVESHDGKAAEAAMLAHMLFEEDNVRRAFSGTISD